MLSQNITGEVIKKYLVVLDDLDRALKMRPTEGEGAAWAEGIELIYRKLQNILDSEGVKRIPAEDEEFDPTRHEAISHEESPDHESGQIIEVVQQGYTLGDRVSAPGAGASSAIGGIVWEKSLALISVPPTQSRQ